MSLDKKETVLLLPSLGRISFSNWEISSWLYVYCAVCDTEEQCCSLCRERKVQKCQRMGLYDEGGVHCKAGSLFEFCRTML